MPDADASLAILSGNAPPPPPMPEAATPAPAAGITDRALSMLSASPEELKTMVEAPAVNHSFGRSATNVGQGFASGVLADIPGMASTVAGAVVPPLDFAQKITKYAPVLWGGQPGDIAFPGSSESINKDVLAPLGVGTQASPAQDAQDRIEQAVGRGVGNLAVPAVGVRALGARAAEVAPYVMANSLPTAVAAGVGSGLGGSVARELAPDSLKDAADIAGQVIGGGGVALTSAGLRAGGGVAAKGIDYFRLPATTAGQRQLAGERILGAASDPEAMRTALNAPDAGAQLIPGSNPTTAEVTGDRGISQLARSAITPENFKGMQAERNSARIGALELTAAADADPAAVGQMFQRQLDQADTLADTHIAALQKQAQAAGEAVGGRGAPQEYGQQMRGLLDQANKVAKDRESQLWQAIDPEGTLGIPTGDLRGSVADIEKGIPSTAKRPDGEERSILDTVAALPEVTPFHDFGALWSRLQAAIRQERMTGGGETPVVRRLSMIRDALGKSLRSTTEGIASAERDGALNPGSPNVSARLADQEALHSHGLGPRFASGTADAIGNSAPARRAVSAGGDPLLSSILRLGDDQGLPGGGPQANFRRGSGAGDRGLGNAPGSAEVPAGEQYAAGGVASGGRAPASPNAAPGGQAPAVLAPFDQAASDRYTAAKAGTLERKQTFRSGPVGNVLAPGPNGTPYRLPDSSVPQKFASSPEGISAYVNAAGGRPEAVKMLHDYLASTLKRLPDGSIDPGAFPRWLERNRAAVDAFPELKDRFGTAAQAQQAVEDAAAARAESKRTEARSAATLFVGNDPVTAVRKALAVGGNGEPAFRELAERVRGNPEAEEGLRRAVVQSIRQRMESTVKDLETGQGFISNNAFQKFIDEKLPALRHVFTEPQISMIRRIGEDMSRENSFTSGSKMPGSNTPQDLGNAMRFSGRGSLLQRMGGALGDTAVFVALEHAGGIATGIAALALKKVAGAMREAGLKSVDDLVERAMLNPEIARTLIAKVTPKNEADILGRLGNQLRTIAVEAPQNAENRDREAIDAVTRGVSAMAPGTAVTARQLAQLSGRPDITSTRARLVSRGLIEQRNGRYIRADSVNAAGALAPKEVAQPKAEAPVPPAFKGVYDAIRERAPTLRRQSLLDINREIEGRSSPLYGTYRPGGLIEHAAAVGEGSPMTHDVLNLYRRSGAIPRDQWSVLASKSDGWAKQFGIDGPPPAIRREEAVAQAFNRWRSGDIQLPPGLRRIMRGISDVAERAVA